MSEKLRARIIPEIIIVERCTPKGYKAGSHWYSPDELEILGEVDESTCSKCGEVHSEKYCVGDTYPPPENYKPIAKSFYNIPEADWDRIEEWANDEANASVSFNLARALVELRFQIKTLSQGGAYRRAKINELRREIDELKEKYPASTSEGEANEETIATPEMLEKAKREGKEMLDRLNSHSEADRYMKDFEVEVPLTDSIHLSDKVRESMIRSGIRDTPKADWDRIERMTKDCLNYSWAELARGLVEMKKDDIEWLKMMVTRCWDAYKRIEEILS